MVIGVEARTKARKFDDQTGRRRALLRSDKLLAVWSREAIVTVDNGTTGWESASSERTDVSNNSNRTYGRMRECVGGKLGRRAVSG